MKNYKSWNIGEIKNWIVAKNCNSLFLPVSEMHMLEGWNKFAYSTMSEMRAQKGLNTYAYSNASGMRAQEKLTNFAYPR